jgi:hypothetical protein
MRLTIHCQGRSRRVSGISQRSLCCKYRINLLFRYMLCIRPFALRGVPELLLIKITKIHIICFLLYILLGSCMYQYSQMFCEWFDFVCYPIYNISHSVFNDKKDRSADILYIYNSAISVEHQLIYSYLSINKLLDSLNDLAGLHMCFCVCISVGTLHIHI